MVRGVRLYVFGGVVLGVLAVLAGCSGGGMFAERETWRAEAELACLSSGAVKEGSGIVRIKSIRGPGMCGADYPLKVATLGDSAALGYSDEVRPPGAIPSRPAQPRWPGPALGDPPVPPPVAQDLPPSSDPRLPPYPRRTAPTPYHARFPGNIDPGEPVSLDAPSAANPASRAGDVYDFRRPYGAAPPPAGSAPPTAPPRQPSGREATYDLSPVPIERRRVLDGGAARRAAPSRDAAHAGMHAEPLPPIAGEDGRPLVGTPRARRRDSTPVVTRERDPEPPLPALGPARAAQATGSVAPVSVQPAATLACPIVSALDQWIANSVQPAAMRWFGSPVAEIKQISAYSCRGMNGNRRARISEHAFGNALDIAAFTLADGRTITVKNGWRGLPEEQGFLRDVQGAACEQFTTVLAPGSNVYHYDHIHVDLMKRRNGHRACNPHAVSGEEVAARAAGTRYAGRRDASVTGSLPFPRRSKAGRSEGDDADWRERALPLAVPGEDGEDD
jgi:hypothetical protein